MSDALVSLLRELVAIDSTSTKSNAPLIAVLQQKLTALGGTTSLQSYRDDAGTEKVNLLARFGPADGLPELALVGHSDCVPFDAAWREALTLTEADGKLYGRGACDTKAFIACALLAVEKARASLTKPLLVVFTADEELGCLGAKRLVEAGLAKTRRAIIGEPTSLRPIHANKGYCLAEIEVHGKEGHSAYPDTGASAIFRASRLLTKLEAFSKRRLRELTDPKFVPPFTSLSVGLISGGKAKNVIPGSCRFTFEWRPLPSQPTELVLQALHRCIDECITEDHEFTATVKVLRQDRGFDTDASADVVQFLAAQSGRAPDAVAFGTEGPQLTALGAVPVVFGPGDITVAHQTGEFVPKDELFKAADILEAAVRRFCC